VSDRVSCVMEGGVADVRLTRPDKRNALDGAMFRALMETGEALKRDRSVRAVVLSGEGRAFCAGLDLGSFRPEGGAGSDGGIGPLLEHDGRITTRAQQVAYAWFEMPAPVIAAVHGACLGGGFQIAVACDVRIVAPDVQMGLLEVNYGLVPDMTGTQLLPRIVGLDVAKALALTGRIVDGAEALRMGLATHVSATPHDDAMALARQIAAKSPDAVRGTKVLLNLAGTVGLAEGLAAEHRTVSRLIGSPNQIEAVSASFERRAPRFSD
jgi:enoyl-CoA hydratase/carnithine racemase